MIVEVQINGVPKYHWQLNENAAINSGHTFQTKVELRQLATNKIIKQVWEEVVPRLKECGKVEIYLVFESKMSGIEHDPTEISNIMQTI